MPSIMSGYDSVQQALTTQQYALSIAQKNVANANNASYTRQDVTFCGEAAVDTVSGMAGVSVQARRNRFIDYSISTELQSLGESSVASNALQQIDSVFTAQDTAGLQKALSDFFNSFSSLSSAPEGLSVRQEVLSNANSLAREFRRLYGSTQQVQASANQDVISTVDEVNSITAQIANINSRIQIAQASNPGDQFTLQDSRQELVEKLSQLVGISCYETESGALTVTTRQGGLLVLGDQSHNLEICSMPSGPFAGVSLNGTEITSTLESGALGGLIEMRDTTIAGYLKTLDDMAAGLISRVNEVHAQGSDLNGMAGSDFFAPFTPETADSNIGAARTMSVVLTDPRSIAAAGSGLGAGNNDNAKLLAAISDEALFASSAETASEVYSSLIYQIGADENAATENCTTRNNVIEQLRNQREASSGVDMNEEAVNVIKYQKAYQASAKFANVLDILSDSILRLLGV